MCIYKSFKLNSSPGAARRLVTFFCVAKRKSPKKTRSRLAAPSGFPLLLVQADGCATRAARSDSARRRPGLGLAQRGAGRGASCRKEHCKTGRYCCRSRTPSFADRVAAAPGSLALRLAQGFLAVCWQVGRLRNSHDPLRGHVLRQCSPESPNLPAKPQRRRRGHNRSSPPLVLRCSAAHGNLDKPISTHIEKLGAMTNIV